MSQSASHGAPFESSAPHSPVERVRAALSLVRKWIPSQGPIGVFVHHNTLHHFEHLKFEDAVETVGRTIGAQPYLEHHAYLEAWRSGRITDASVRWAIEEALAQGTEVPLPSILPASELLFHLLQIPVAKHNRHSLTWLIEHAKEPPFVPVKKKGQRPMSAETALWGDGRASLELKLEPVVMSHPEWWSGTDQDPLTPYILSRPQLDAVNHRTITLIAAYLDQGISHWSMPRDPLAGLWATVVSFFDPRSNSLLSEVRWPRRFAALYQTLLSLPTEQTIATLLTALGIPEPLWSDFILRDILEISSWAGLAGMLEQNPALFPGETRSVALADLVALRLAVHLAFDQKNSPKTSTGPIDSDKHTRPKEIDRQDLVLCSLTYQILALAESAGFSLSSLGSMPQALASNLATTLWTWDDVIRRRILHQAYERSFQEKMFEALLAKGTSHTRRLEAASAGARPPFQAAFCIDEREESLRRHLEEILPNVETCGAAGFFNVAMAFKPAGEARPVPLCPVVVTPGHLVTEDVPPETDRPRGGRLSRLLARVPRYLHVHGRSLWLGQVVQLLAGGVGAVELFVRTVTPRWTARMAAWRDTQAGKNRTTMLYRRQDPPGPPFSSDLGPLVQGFTPEEMADRVAGLLKTIGLTKNFARVVFLIGHGSTTNNNPFASAYECGACGGRRGDRNGRTFALMANRPDVRTLVKERGVDIPEDTVFVGACHDTCADRIDYFDEDRIPTSHRQDLATAQSYLDQALLRNAQERCRRFANAMHLSADQARLHVTERAFNMREPRPEYGHGSNAACIIGHRDFSRGLFLDRRSFLVSYDWRQDQSGSILKAILAAVMPVCSGISLEYYFSRVDNQRYGAGTKLPHNIVGMLGVMDGLTSDLRTGLPWQTVEIHEPMRLFTVIEAPLARIREALSQLKDVYPMLENKWIVIGYCDPETSESGWLHGSDIELFKGQVKALPVYADSRSYYRGKSQHLTPVLIKSPSETRRSL